VVSSRVDDDDDDDDGMVVSGGVVVGLVVNDVVDERMGEGGR